MKRGSSTRCRASLLAVTLYTLAALSVLAAFTLLRVQPRVGMAYQNAAWQEARVVAEAGIDCAINDLNHNATGFTPGAFPGWQQEAPAAPVPNGIPPGLLKQLLGGTLSKVASITAKIAKKTARSSTPATPEPTVTTAPLFLDNLKIATVSSAPSEINVRLWGLAPESSPHSFWYRIRSMATLALPPVARQAPAKFDAPLRRFSLRNIRPSLQSDDAGKPTTVPLPNVSRTVEALVEPILPFELALWSGQSLSLAPTGSWTVDSFDSGDDQKSNGGLYPGAGSPLSQANGDVANGMLPAYGAPLAPLIAANGAKVSGAVATNGGDDPSTDGHENVSGAMRIDPTRIRDDFSREMPMTLRPSDSAALAPPVSGSYTPGPASAPAFYSVPGTLRQLRIATPAGKVAGAIVIMIDGDLDLDGPLIVPPSVIALLFVRGSIYFRDNVNSGPWSSNRASQLMIFNDPETSPHTALQAIGSISVTAAFYGPQTDITLDGAVNWIGSLAAANFQVTGDGDGGIHYDQALATVGPPIGFRISRYIEDVRE